MAAELDNPDPSGTQLAKAASKPWTVIPASRKAHAGPAA
jgi:hypothetical protein